MNTAAWCLDPPPCPHLCCCCANHLAAQRALGMYKQSGVDCRINTHRERNGMVSLRYTSTCEAAIHFSITSFQVLIQQTTKKFVMAPPLLSAVCRARAGTCLHRRSCNPAILNGTVKQPGSFQLITRATQLESRGVLRGGGCAYFA